MVDPGFTITRFFVHLEDVNRHFTVVQKYHKQNNIYRRAKLQQRVMSRASVLKILFDKTKQKKKVRRMVWCFHASQVRGADSRCSCRVDTSCEALELIFDNCKCQRNAITTAVAC